MVTNLQERKGDLGKGQAVSEIREAVEEDFYVQTKGQEFELIKQLEKEIDTKNASSPATNSAFNCIKDHEGRIQDGKGRKTDE